MSPLHLRRVGVFSCLVVAFSAAAIISQPTSKHDLRSDFFTRFQNGKFNPDEGEEIVRLASSYCSDSYLAEGATAFLRASGFSQVRIYGFVDQDGKMQQLGHCWPETFLIDLTFDKPIPPGIYWGKQYAFSIDLIRPDGSVESYGISVIPKE